MSALLAPYNNGMRLGQGFNSYTQQICLDHAVLEDTPSNRARVYPHYTEPMQKGNPAPPESAEAIKALKARLDNLALTATADAERDQAKRDELLADDLDTKPALPPWTKPQIVTYSSRFVDKISEVTDSMAISGALSIQTATVGGTATGSYVDSDKFKESDINFHLQVKVTNQILEAKEYSLFNKIENVKTSDFTAVYGDTFISGWEEGGELNAVISMKVSDKSKIFEIKASLDATVNVGAVKGHAEGKFEMDKDSLAKSAETTIAVNWSGGGSIKDPDEQWTMDSITKAAAAFPDLVAITPQRTYAILTKYINLESFQRQKDDYSPLDYENAGIYTNSLLDHYMDYKLMWKQLAIATYELENNRATIDFAQTEQEIFDLANVRRLPPGEIGDKLRQSGDAKPLEERLVEQREMVEKFKKILDATGVPGVTQQTAMLQILGEEVAPAPTYEQFTAFNPTFGGLIRARKVCRVEMAKIVNEVDLVTKRPTIALDTERDAYFLHPLVFKQLLPVVRSWTDDMVAGGDQLSAPIILGYQAPPPRDKTLPSLATLSVKDIHPMLQASITKWQPKAKNYRMVGGFGRLAGDHLDSAELFNDIEFLNPTYRIVAVQVWQGTGGATSDLRGIKVIYANGQEKSHGTCVNQFTTVLKLDPAGTEYIYDTNIGFLQATTANETWKTRISGLSLATQKQSVLAPALTSVPDNWRFETAVQSRPDMNERWSLRGFWGFVKDGVIIHLGMIYGKDTFVPVPAQRPLVPLSQYWYHIGPLAQERLNKIEAARARENLNGQLVMGYFSTPTAFQHFTALDVLRPYHKIRSIDFCKKPKVDLLSGMRVNYVNADPIVHGTYTDETRVWTAELRGADIISIRTTRAREKTAKAGTVTRLQNVEFILGDADGNLPTWPMNLSAARYIGPGDPNTLDTFEGYVEAAPKLDGARWCVKGFYGWDNFTHDEITGIGAIWGRA